ncbi:MAG: hypothetical protein ACFHXK_18780 [bacterium]
MTSLRAMYKPKTVFALALFLIGQAFASAHAIEFGNQPHEHDGVVCVAILNDELDDLLATNQLVTDSCEPDQAAAFCLPPQNLFSRNFATKPPATGPPSI